MTPKVMIILGSGSDIAIAEKSMKILEKLEIPYSLKILIIDICLILY